MNSEDIILCISSFLYPHDFGLLNLLSQFHNKIIEKYAYVEFLKSISHRLKFPDEYYNPNYWEPILENSNCEILKETKNLEELDKDTNDRINENSSIPVFLKNSEFPFLPSKFRRKNLEESTSPFAILASIASNQTQNQTENGNNTPTVSKQHELKQLSLACSYLIRLFPHKKTIYYSKVGTKEDFDCYTMIFQEFKFVKDFSVILPFDAYHSWTHASKIIYPEINEISDLELKEALYQIGREAHGRCVWNLMKMDFKNSTPILTDWGHFNRWNNHYTARVKSENNKWKIAFTMYGEANPPFVVLGGENNCK